MTTFIILIVIFVAFAVLIAVLGRRSPSGTASAASVATGQGSPPLPAGGVAEALALLATCARPREGLNLSAVVGIHVTDHHPADWHYEMAGGSCTLQRGTAAHATVTLRADTRTWLALANKQVSFTGAAMNGSLQSDGDTSVLIRLDDEFAGAPDPTRLAPQAQPASPAADPAPATPSSALDPSGATPVRIEATGESLHEVIRIARESAHLPPDERRAAMLSALQQKLGPGTEVHLATSGAMTFSERIDSAAARAAIHQALQGLPPGATREQKLEAVRAALRDVPDAQNLLTFLDTVGSSHHGAGTGLGGALAGLLLESLLEGLLKD